MTPASRSLADRDARNLPRCRAAFADFALLLGWPADAEAKRAAEIEVLPKVEWRGRPLVSLTCSVCKRTRNVPESIPWCVVSIPHFVCEWCARFGTPKQKRLPFQVSDSAP